MKIFNTKSELNLYVSKLKEQGHSIGFVPTMGALHQGHLSLILASKEVNDITVVSIFVNPTQFDNQNDLETYPQPLEHDIKLLKSVACDLLYTPSAADVYDNDVASEAFDFDGLEYEMEGRFRDGHFNGVGTIVEKLFSIVQPDTAYFGEKDFQQLQIIKKLVEKYRLEIVIEGCPIYREIDGLAMSSRNIRLSPDHRKAAPFIYKTLMTAKDKLLSNNVITVKAWVQEQFNKHPHLDLEYFTIADEASLKDVLHLREGRQYRAFIAVFAGDIRLIDNIDL